MNDVPSSQRIIIACGGTGGHMFPGIAVAEQLLALGHRPLLLISRKEVDAEGSRKYAHLEFRTVPAIAKPRTFSLRMIPFFLRFVGTLWSSYRLLRRERAHAVLGMGGFTSLAPVMAGRMLGLRTYMHDSNAVPGRANRLTARFCTAVLLGLGEAAKRFPGRACQEVGTPVREEMLHAPQPAAARVALGMPVDKPLLLVTGGSQGAQKLNSLMVEAARELPDVQFLIIAGKADQTRVASLAEGCANVRVLGFCSDMPAAYAAADAVVARSGASTLTELSVIGKACLLVPYPFAADNHQFYNAQIFADAGAACLCEQKDLTQSRIVEFVRQNVLNLSVRSAMQQAMLSRARPDAARVIAQLLVQSV